MKCEAAILPLGKEPQALCGKPAIARVKTPQGWLYLCKSCLFWMRSAVGMWKLDGFKVEMLNISVEEAEKA